MILVTLGTQDKRFERLIKQVEDCVKNKTINEEVIVQAGYTEYQSKYLKIIDYVSHSDFEKYINDCSLLITHGGVGSIMNGLNKNKKVIVCPRLSKYKEHTNDHQLDIVNEFAKQGYIIPLNENDSLDDALKLAKKFKTKKITSNTNNFIKILEKFIENN